MRHELPCRPDGGSKAEARDDGVEALLEDLQKVRARRSLPPRSLGDIAAHLPLRDSVKRPQLLLLIEPRAIRADLPAPRSRTMLAGRVRALFEDARVFRRVGQKDAEPAHHFGLRSSVSHRPE